MDRDYTGYLTSNCINCPHWIDDQWDFGCGSIQFQDCLQQRAHEIETTKQHRYQYIGPVMIFNQGVTRRWMAITTAVSERKALNNLAYRWKIEHGYAPNAKVTLPGRIKIID